MQDRLSTYPGRIKLTPVVGQENVYDVERMDEPSQLGTELKTETLLSDATAALLGLDNTATPNTAFAQLKSLMDTVEAKMASVSLGSYAGTGSYGVYNPNKLTFAFEPKLLCINGITIVRNQGTASTVGGNCVFTWSGKTVSWYHTANATGQLNNSGTTYHYVALS